ncbi:MAG: D-tyrosyl-tRNA(Tyr) deacylase [Actinobacteria bacterium]|nr:D-tyrosyl-tRNA(Tyr) deacylase [Actinomycetota bacterium]
MRALIQRVRSASVTVSHPPDADGRRVEEVTGAIGPGLCALIGVTHHDDVAGAVALAAKIWNLRVLDDDDGVMNRSLADRSSAGEAAEVLVVSQFTLYGDTRRGRRPSWLAAAGPEVAEPLVERVGVELGSLGAHVEAGRFRTDMAVALVNDGPVTLLLEV